LIARTDDGGGIGGAAASGFAGWVLDTSTRVGPPQPKRKAMMTTTMAYRFSMFFLVVSEGFTTTGDLRRR